MFSQLATVRLKTAEKAMRDGRLDEAYRLASAADLREHRRAAAILSSLAEKFLERARNHYRADRFTDAMMDLDRAEAGGVLKEEIAELRSHVRTVAAEAERREQERRDRVDAAIRRIEGGSLAAGRQILERASEADQTAEHLRKVVDERAEQAASLILQAESLMAQGQTAAAADRLRRARAVDAHREELAKAESHLCRTVLDAARGALFEGRLGRCADELNCLGDLGARLPARSELTDAIASAQEAARHAAAHQYGEARRHLLALARLAPEAKWVHEIADQLRRLDDLHTLVLSGPLGERMATAAPVKKSPPIARAPFLEDTVALSPRTPLPGELPERLLLLVDGGGSYLLLRKDRAAVGRAAADHPADIPLLGDLAERHAEIARFDDDYFVISARDVEVGGTLSKQHLLQDGDRLVFGKKAKMTFRLPTRKSPSAALDLSDTTKMPNDVRRVVLFHHHVTIGNSASAHVRCRHAGVPLTLFERNGGLYLRARNDGHVDPGSISLPMGVSTEICGVRMVLEPWRAGASRGATV